MASGMSSDEIPARSGTTVSSSISRPSYVDAVIDQVATNPPLLHTTSDSDENNYNNTQHAKCQMSNRSRSNKPTLTPHYL